MVKSNYYLGDGLYANFDGMQYELYTKREGAVTHWVALDDLVLEAFFDFIELTRNVKIKAEPAHLEKIKAEMVTPHREEGDAL